MSDFHITTEQIDAFNRIAITAIISILVGMILFGLIVCGAIWLIEKTRRR